MSSKGDKTIQINIVRHLAAKPWKVWGCILSINDFSKYMPSVREATILFKEGNKIRTKWFIELEQIPIRWIEEETLDLGNMTIYFRAIEGDLTEFNGKWMVEKSGDAAEVHIEANVQIGIPRLDKVIAPILEEKLIRNFHMMLQAIYNKIVINTLR